MSENDYILYGMVALFGGGKLFQAIQLIRNFFKPDIESSQKDTVIDIQEHCSVKRTECRNKVFGCIDDMRKEFEEKIQSIRKENKQDVQKLNEKMEDQAKTIQEIALSQAHTSGKIELILEKIDSLRSIMNKGDK